MAYIIISLKIAGSWTVGMLIMQHLLILFIAVNCFMMVARGRKIDMGHKDLNLLSVVVGIPIIVVIVSNGFQIIGSGRRGLW